MKRITLHQRIRRDLLWFVLAFVVLQLGLALAVEHALPDVRDPEYARKEERLKARRAEKPEHSLVLMLGSSRAAMALRARELSADLDARGVLVLNGALMGAGPMLELTCLHRTLAAGLRPDLLFVEVVPMHFHQPAGLTLEERTLSGSRLTDREIVTLRPYCDEPDRLRRRWLQSRLLPCVGHQAELRDRLDLDCFADGEATDEALRMMDDHGWHPRHNEVTADQRLQHTQQALQQYHWLRGEFQPAVQAVRALGSLLDVCRSQAIPVALVMLPEGSAFRDHYPPALRTDIDAFLQSFSRQRQVPLIDARHWVSDDGFWDAHHLLPSGAGAFSIRFENEVMRNFYDRLDTPRADRWALRQIK